MDSEKAGCKKLIFSLSVFGIISMFRRLLGLFLEIQNPAFQRWLKQIGSNFTLVYHQK
jgi:hypothetical protein